MEAGVGELRRGSVIFGSPHEHRRGDLRSVIDERRDTHISESLRQRRLPPWRQRADTRPISSSSTRQSSSMEVLGGSGSAGFATTPVQLRSSTALVGSGDCEGNTIVTGYAHQAYTTERSMQSLERVAEALGSLIIHTGKPAARPGEELPALQSAAAPTELHRAFL
jgi:hypothetical protein